MPESEIGGFLGKTTANLPNWAWGLVIVGGVGVGYLFIRSRNASAAAAPTATQDSTSQTAPYSGPIINPIASGGGQQSPVMTVPGGSSGQVPIMPPGYTPIYDSNGNLIGWEPPGAPPTQTPPGGTGGTPTGGKWVNPLIPQGQLPAGTKYSTAADLQSHPTLNWQGVTYWMVPGPSGKLYGVAGATSSAAAKMAPTQVLLYAPPSFYH